MITGFQLKAAKAVLNLTAKDIAEPIGLHPGSIIRLCDTENLKYLHCNTKNLVLINKYFEDSNIIFSTEHSIYMRVNKECLDSNNKMTRFQLKAARIATGLTQEELSIRIDASSSMLSLLEGLANQEYIQSSKIDVMILKKFFIHLGIIFPNDLMVTLIKDPICLVKKLKY